MPVLVECAERFDRVVNGRGEETSGSDVDLLVTIPHGMGLIGMGRVEKELSDLLAALVDLVPADGLKPSVRKNVLADLVVL